MALQIRGTDWSVDEVELCVASYFEHLAINQAGGKFVKENLYRELAKQTGRSTKSIGLKFQNISAILDELGRNWMVGLSPMHNYQKLLTDKVELHLENAGAALFFRNENFTNDQLNEPAPFVLEAPPNLKVSRSILPDFMERLVRKFDYIERDLRNRSLGTAGEEFVLNFERHQLNLAGRSDLSSNVRWVSKEEGDGAGYDILSFTDRGDKKFIEVKTTIGKSRTPFFISRNEHTFCKQVGDDFRLVRLYDFRREVRGFELKGELEKYVSLSTELFRAEFSSPDLMQPSTVPL